MASELSMNGRKKIETLQKEFTQKFPYLTLVFLDKERRAIDISKSLSEVRQAKGADVSIIASLKVNTLEKRFLENFGLVVEVAYQKSDKVVYTKDSVDKTLNELNKWCQENDCQPFEFKKSFTGNTLSSVQEQLFEAIKEYYPNAEAKKINKDNYLDIHIPEINNKRGTHLFFNTAKDGIKIGFYCRDEDFVEEVLSKSSNIEKYAQGIRILKNPIQNDVEEATASALSFIEELTGEQNEKKEEDVDIDAILNEKGEDEEEYEDDDFEEDDEEEDDDFEEDEEVEEDDEEEDDFEEEEDDEEEDLDEILKEMGYGEEEEEEEEENEETDQENDYEEDEESNPNAGENLIITVKNKGELEIFKSDLEEKLNLKDAKEACRKIGEGWRLPDEDEFQAIYEILFSQIKGNFKEDVYWSSTETYNNDPYFFDLEELISDWQGISATDKFYVRPVKPLNYHLEESLDEEYEDVVEEEEEYEDGEFEEEEEEEDVDFEEDDEEEAESSDKASLFFPINANTTIVYDEVFEINEGMIKVKKDDLFGFLDKEGNEIVPCNYLFASDFKDGVSYIVSKNEDDEIVFDYINYNNERYFSLKNYKNGNSPNKYGAWVQKDSTANWDFYDLKGQLVHNVDFENVKNFNDGYSWCIKDKTIFLLSISGQTQKIIASDDEICIDLDNGLIAISINKKYGFYKLDGTIVTQFIYDFYVLNLSKGNICVNIDEKWGVINSDGLVVIPCIYDDIEDGNNDLFIVTLDDKKGVVDVTGNIIIEIQYDDINGFEDDYAIIELNELYGIINLKGQEIVSCISSEWPSISKSKFVSIYTENWDNLIDLKTGNPVLKGSYAAILVDGNNLLVRVNDKWGWIDNEENVIINFKFDRALPFADSDLARVQDDEKFGFIDKTGNFKIKPRYADLEPFDGNYAIASLDGDSYGLIDKNGNQIVEFKYSSIEYDTEGFFKLTPIDLDNTDFDGEQNETDFLFEETDDQIQTVSIGNQKWATLNLDVDTFRNGDSIPHAESDEDWIIAGANKQPAWCFSNNDPSNGEKYGKLYNWYAVNDPRGLAPSGYHVPNEAEWDTLDAYLGLSGAIKMRKENGWKDGQSGKYTWVVNCQNTSGFSGLPGGLRTGDGKFSTDKSGVWWSRTESNPDSAFYCCLYNDNDILNRRNDRKFFGFSVRCIKN
jgi:uncharacterized protein (TIGR02145 family)